ncbi:MAG TPA: amidohydrolase [Anaerolineales bacterium]|nr:amidohydrolase [Anaerolineales bacterium]
MTPRMVKATLLHNGVIHPRAGSAETTGALLLLGERVLESGSADDLAAAWTGKLQSIDLQGRTVLPGLCDAHLHLEKYARAVTQLDCATTTRDECLRRVAVRAQGARPGEWVLGHGWNQNDWGGHGTAAELDHVAPENPVYLTAKSLHAAWVNSRALQSARIDPATPDPVGGAIVRDGQGAPTGILLEFAMSLVADRIPVASTEAIAGQIAAAQVALWRFGITAVHDFDGPSCFRALQILHAQGSLRLHVLKSIPIEFLDQAVALGLQSGFGDDWLRLGHVKIFADGALGPRTAAMLQPYDGEPGNTGISLIDREGILEAGIRAAGSGLPLAIHAIGDRANHDVIEGLAALRRFEREHALPHLRHRIEHLQLLHPDDLARPAELGLVVSMQPIHATSDMPMADRYWGDRRRTAYAWRSQVERGALAAFGSDAPVESPNPFLGLHAAVTRRRADGSPGPQGWVPQERISLEAALLGFTEGPAEVAGMAGRLGRLQPGSYADLIVLEDDPYRLPPTDLASIQPLATMVAGRWVYPEDEPGF